MNNFSLPLLFAMYLMFLLVLNIVYYNYKDKFKKVGVEVAGISVVWKVIRKEILPSSKIFRYLRRYSFLLDFLVVFIFLSFLLAVKIYFENLAGIFKSIIAAKSPVKGVAVPIIPIIPGITVSLSILPTLIIVIGLAVLVHEGMHAIVGLIEGAKIKSFGIALILIILAPFVEIDENDFTKLKLRSKLRVLSAGVSGNIVLALISLILLACLVPLLFNVHLGLYVAKVVENTPAAQINLPNSSVIVAINGTKLDEGMNILDYLFNSRFLFDRLSAFKSKGEVLILTLMDPQYPYNTYNFTVIRENITQPIGVILYPYAILEPKSFIARLLGYKLQSFLIWSFALNLGLAAINATPLFITDGGKALDEFLKSKYGKQGLKLSKVTQTFFVTVVLINILTSLMLYIP